MVTDNQRDRLLRLVLRHGEDAAKDCINFALDLAEREGVTDARTQAGVIIDGGIIPEPQAEVESKPGRPGVPDAGLMAAWACVTVVMEQQGITKNAACKWLCRPRGTRRNPVPPGIGLGDCWRWGEAETLRYLHKRACSRREEDEDFKTVSDLCLPAFRERLLE